MTKDQEKTLSEQTDEFVNKVTEEINRARTQGMIAGGRGILGAVLEMCKNGKTVEDIKKFCETSLGMDGMKLR